MESRLPRFGFVGKRPASGSTTSLASNAALRQIVPSERVNTTSATLNRGATSHNLKLPLSAIDILNVPTGHAGGSLALKRRHGSPDHNKPPPVVRAKIRRSRSASELNYSGAPLNVPHRFGTSSATGANRPLCNVPPKLSKSTTSLRLVTSSAKPRIQPATARPPLATGRPPSGPSSVAKRPIAAAGASTGRTAANSSASSSTGSVAPKKFAPYDYKGRLGDLQERHKALKDKLDKTQEALAEYQTLNDQFEDSQNSLFRCMEQLKSEQSQTDCLRQQLSSQEIKLESLAASINDKLNDIKQLSANCDRLSADNAQMRPELLALRQRDAEMVARNEDLQRQIAGLDGQLVEAHESLFRSNMERKELHNVVMDLRGNIRVFCRVRPPLDSEEMRQVCGWQYLDEASLEISTLEAAGATKKTVRHEFSFDQVFHPRSSQGDIFELVSPLIQSAMDGYNVCIFAYGQTGSGKTFTMDGVPEDIGIIPRTVDLLFDCIRNYRRLGWEYEIKVTFLEIYNEVLYDLLSNENKDMDIRMVSAKSPTEIYVSNITEVTVAKADELRDLMRLAKSNRATASTAGNERSSRSHAVTRMQLIGRHDGKQETCVGNINLVDLAGSESPKTSTRMEETKKINKSLSELTNVIMALMQRQEHIPYRNSKLTHLLMPSLGGNSKTLMFINVAPFQDCFVESVKSLRFAASVNQCKMSKAKRNKYLNTSAE